MAKTRVELQTLLEEILGSRNVYFQPPESLKLKYPAIIYHLSGMQSLPADNIKYIKCNQYMVTLVDRDPESEIKDKILDLPMCSHDRRYAADNLTHDVFTLYF